MQKCVMTYDADCAAVFDYENIYDYDHIYFHHINTNATPPDFYENHTVITYCNIWSVFRLKLYHNLLGI